MIQEFVKAANGESTPSCRSTTLEAVSGELRMWLFCL